MPQALDLADQAKYPEAFALAVQSEHYIPSDPILAKLWPKISRTLSIRSDPAGADVWINSYRGSDADWRYVGRTPLDSLRIARDIFRVRLSKAGFDTALMVAPTAWFPDRVDLVVPLVAAGDVPRGMVRIQGGTDAAIIQPHAVGDFWIDRYEVTNREFKRFVDAGGYEKREYWKNKFVRDGRVFSWHKPSKAFGTLLADQDRWAGSWGIIQREKTIFRSPASAGTKRQRMPSSSVRRCRRFIIGGTPPDSASASRSSRSATSAAGNRIPSEQIALSARTGPSTWLET